MATVGPAKFESGDDEAVGSCATATEASGQATGDEEGGTGAGVVGALWDSVVLVPPDRLNICFHKEDGPVRLFSCGASARIARFIRIRIRCRSLLLVPKPFAGGIYDDFSWCTRHSDSEFLWVQSAYFLQPVDCIFDKFGELWVGRDIHCSFS